MHMKYESIGLNLILYILYTRIIIKPQVHIIIYEV